MDAGLALFITVVVVDVVILLFDWLLLEAGVKTITSRVRQQPILGVPILLWQLAGFGGLCVHFYLGGPS